MSSSSRGNLPLHLEGSSALRQCVNGSGTALYYPHGIISWSDAHLVSMTDASHGQEQVEVGGELEPHRSQKGRMCFLSNSQAVDGAQMPVHLLSYSSTVIQRVCRSTLATETYAMVGGVEEAVRLRAAIVDW